MVQPPLFALLLALAIFGLHRLSMLAHFRWTGPEQANGISPDEAQAPRITVQLPLYNERTVAARLIRAASELRWPRDRFELQILDDSTDETCGIVDAEVRKLSAKGIQAIVVRRNSRTGFKAGALDAGMKISEADFFCVFDADFIPEPDFLERTVPQFQDENIGMVQARWGHLNRDESQFTRAQSTLLDGHFVVEHTVRHQRGLFFNFNGTAGIWRREAIDEAGGWQHDTLTEDLDLSYRAQLAGWKFAYIPSVVAPAEVPPSIEAFKSQQHRWAKGSVQVYRKLWREILTGDTSPAVKLEAMLHLTGNVGYPLVLALAIILPFTLGQEQVISWWIHALSLLLCTLPFALFYDSSQRAQGRTFLQRLRDVPCAMALGIGMSLSQTQAVLAGLGRRTGTFVRTPKRGDTTGSDLRTYRLNWSAWRGFGLPEFALASWLAWALFQAAELKIWGAMPFLLLFFTGFAWVGALSLKTRFGRT